MENFIFCAAKVKTSDTYFFINNFNGQIIIASDNYRNLSFADL